MVEEDNSLRAECSLSNMLDMHEPASHRCQIVTAGCQHCKCNAGLAAGSMGDLVWMTCLVLVC